MSSPVSEQSKLYLLEWGAPKEEKDAPKEKLRIYSLKGRTIRQAATLFQEKHPELEVTYEIGYTGENGVTLPDAIRTLNTELMAGEGPDILILDGLPADSYVDKGILEDLTDLVEPDKEKYFYNMISAYNGGGSIYQMRQRSFYVFICPGRRMEMGFTHIFRSSGSWLQDPGMFRKRENLWEAHPENILRIKRWTCIS